jgi:hypothetical protein
MKIALAYFDAFFVAFFFVLMARSWNKTHFSAQAARTFRMRRWESSAGDALAALPGDLRHKWH